MQVYVAGLLFSDEGLRVALIRKNHPEWQAGKLNAIGGKVEAGEDPRVAMAREFEEEAGVAITDWEQALRLCGKDWMVHFYRAFSSEDLYNTRTAEEEEVSTFFTPYIDYRETIPNLRWIIPLVSDRSLMTPVNIAER